MSIEFMRDAATFVLFAIGGAAVLTGAIGVLRFPDFYTRLHAAGITDTAGAALIILGMMVQAPSWLVVAKLGFVAFFLFMTSPVSTHAIAHAAWVVGLRPMIGPELKRDGEAP